MIGHVEEEARDDKFFFFFITKQYMYSKEVLKKFKVKGVIEGFMFLLI